MKKKKMPKLNKIIYLFSGFLIILTLFVLWITGYIFICGDHYCAEKECSQGCLDCSPLSCTNNICQPQVGENCLNSEDCRCEQNQVCTLNRKNTDNHGCYDIKCGDNYCDAKLESSENCCQDCGCSKGYYCNANKCIFQQPKLDIIDFDFLKNVSASTLYSNKYLIDDNNIKHPFARFLIQNNAPNTAYNVVYHIQIKAYTSEEIKSIGNLKSGEIYEIDWYPTGTSKLLTTNEDSNFLIQLTLEFKDKNNQKHSTEKSFPIIIKGKNSMGVLTSLAQFITPIDPVVRQAVSESGTYDTSTPSGIHKAAKAIWNLLSDMNIDYISDPAFEYIQYPAETLKTKKGDCDDLSILYATMLASVGVKTELIYIPGHIFSGYLADGYFWPVETTMLGSSFETASSKGKIEFSTNPNKKIIDISKEQTKKSLKIPSNINVGKVNLNYSNIKVSANPSAKWVCSHHEESGTCDLFELKVYCKLDFINLGNGEGKKCVKTQITVDNNIAKTETICKNVKANSEVKATLLYKKQEPYSYSVKYSCGFEEI